MKKRLLVTVTGIMCAVVLSACGSTEVEPETPDVSEELAEEAPEEVSEEMMEEAAEQTSVFGDFTAVTTDGEEVDQEIFAQADLTMVNIWGTFCGPCIYEMPDLGEIAREYEGTGFQIVGIVTDAYEPGDETVEEILEVTGADYTHLLLSMDLYNNYLSSVQVVPTTIFVDGEGKEVGIYTGSREKDAWVEVIEEMREKVSG